MDVVHFMKKMRQPLENLSIGVDAERRKEHPRVYVKIWLEYRFTGALDAAKTIKAVKLSEGQYCSVSAMLKKTAAISYKVFLNDELIQEHEGVTPEQ